MQNISFISHGYKLSGNLFVAPQPRPLAFLFLHGWMGYQNTKAAQALADFGFTSMSYDMRGNGKSEGNLADFSRADFIADAVVAYDFLKEQVGSDVEIGLVGSSFGSYTGILLSELRSVKCLSLRVPATYPDDGFDDPQLPQVGSAKLTAWRLQPLGEPNRAFTALHNFGGKVQVIESELDDQVPHQAVQNYIDSVADEKNLEYNVVRGAPHTLVSRQQRVEYAKLLVNWVRCLKSSPRRTVL